MSGEEIKKKIEENDKIIESKIGFFVLNKKVQQAIEENKYLRSICPHRYNNFGCCKYCGKEVE